MNPSFSSKNFHSSTSNSWWHSSSITLPGKYVFCDSCTLLKKVKEKREEQLEQKEQKVSQCSEAKERKEKRSEINENKKKNTRAKRQFVGVMWTGRWMWHVWWKKCRRRCFLLEEARDSLKHHSVLVPPTAPRPAHFLQQLHKHIAHATSTATTTSTIATTLAIAAAAAAAIRGWRFLLC
jgi:hypothetical protein